MNVSGQGKSNDLPFALVVIASPFSPLTSLSSYTFPPSVVEQVEDGASLHGVSLNNDHVCFLLKAVVSLTSITLISMHTHVL